MKKNLCALAIGATLFSPVVAMAADVKVYGRAHVSLDYLDDGDNYNELGFSSNSSRLGFKAEKEFNGLTAFTQVETEVNFAQGSDADIAFASRDTFVGLKGDFGQVRVGRFDSPFKVARGPVNFFGDMVGDIRNVLRAENHRFDERNPNTIEYKTPKVNGFVVAAALSLHETALAGTAADSTTEKKGDDKKNQAYDISLTYKEGPLDFAAAYERYEEDATRGERDAIRVAAAYKIMPELNLGAIYQLSKHKVDTGRNADTSVYGVAADYQLTPKTSVRGQYMIRDVDSDNNSADLIALGVEHRLDSALRVYANFATALNDSNSRITPWSQGRSNQVSAATGEDAMGLSVGMRYDF